jgi:putative transposase
VLDERVEPVRFRIRDRDAKVTGPFDEVFGSERTGIVPTPVRAPRANACAARWVGSVGRGCLDWVLIFGRRQLEAVLRVYIEHDHHHRPHRALRLSPPLPEPRVIADGSARSQRDIGRSDRLGGLLHEDRVAS